MDINNLVTSSLTLPTLARSVASLASGCDSLAHTQRAYEGLELLLACADRAKLRGQLDDLQDIACLMRVVNASVRDEIARLCEQAAAVSKRSHHNQD